MSRGYYQCLCTPFLAANEQTTAERSKRQPRIESGTINGLCSVERESSLASSYCSCTAIPSLPTRPEIALLYCLSVTYWFATSKVPHLKREPASGRFGLYLFSFCDFDTKIEEGEQLEAEITT